MRSKPGACSPASRRLVALFLLVLVPPAAALGGLGLLVLEQDRRLIVERDRERAAAAADAVVLMTITFTPDRKHVVFGGKVRGVAGIWSVGIDGGEPRRIPLDASTVSMWRFNNKTWQVAYAPSNGPTFEVRVLEHFLPAAVERTAQAARRR